MSDSKGNGLRWLKRLFLLGFVLILLIVIGLFITIKTTSEPRPEGQPGPQADALAEAMMQAIGHENWEQTGAVRWRFRGKNDHLWDRKRHLARVRWDDVEVLINLSTRKGRATRAGTPVPAEELEPLLQKAWAYWANDSFWLNPVSKAFDDGTRRALVDLEDGRKGLLVSYESGGVTPGDAYLWILDENNQPVAWKMWVQIIPVGGLETSWEAWSELKTGVRVSSLHKTPLGDLRLDNIEAATTLAELEPNDPFADL